MVSKWEGQFLGGIIMMIIAIIVAVLAKQLPTGYTGLSDISIPLGVGGLALTLIGVWTKKKSGH